MTRHNTIEVAVRVRPDESTCTAPQWVKTNASFASALVEGSNQSVCFQKLGAKLLTRLQEGFSCTLLAYGQTGSGKTYTMFGPEGCLTESALNADDESRMPRAWGIFPRVALKILSSAAEKGTVLQASAIEVYNNVAYDLLNDTAPLQVSRTKPICKVIVTGGGCEMGERNHGTTAGADFAHPSTCQCFKCFQAKSKLASEQKKEKMKARNKAEKLPTVKQLRGTQKQRKQNNGNNKATQFSTIGEKLWPLKSPKDVAQLAMKIANSRRSAGHNLNDHSSRSHCLIKLHITSSSRARGMRQLVRRRQFLFVDLAGSERTQKSGVGGERLTEAKQINSSLTVLGRVIRALGEGRAHVPYRDSTLTMLLRSSFDDKTTAGAHASVVINIAPGEKHKDESICSLRFGKRMSRVSNNACVAATTDASDEKSSLETQIEMVKKKLLKMKKAGDGGGFVANAIPSEKKSLQANMRRLKQAESRLMDLRKQIAEATTTVAGKFDPNRNSKSTSYNTAHVARLRQQLSEAILQVDNVRPVVERQKTIKKLWLEPKPTYAAAQAELITLEAKLSQINMTPE